MKEVQTLGVLPLGRPTFDVAFAEEKLSAMLNALAATGKTLLGPGKLLMNGAETDDAIEQIKTAAPDIVLILQVTFTDAAATMRIAGRFDQPLCLWAVPEPRDGGRLRLNAFCGLNLASHALGLNGREFSWIYADPQGAGVGAELEALLSGGRKVAPMEGEPSPADSQTGLEIAAQLNGLKIGRLGAHPDGFDTCRYDKSRLHALAGIEVDELALQDLFDKALTVPEIKVDHIRAAAERDLAGLEAVDQQQLDRSLRLKAAMEIIRERGGYDAFAVRCWPETFTEYGGAVCGPVSMMGEAHVPCACEADVYGAATQLLLQAVADAPVFLVDLVDMDAADNSGVVWHCGQAPISMADPDAVAEATIHTNRKMPLLYQFPLKPGPVTFMRLSQARGRQKMIIASGEMLKRPMAFTGTSGVVRFDRHTGDVLPDIMNSGLEHHMALAYGEHTEPLLAAAAALDIPVIRL
ncbi:L-fucose/L-arabinose isomerase family protein [Hoeflea sp. TYP-13]|uniref:L-fucose/L-arabinose isomerase family protein n=1 Tax=Hoeflea sp. TYP-13 TaxID=3230023 RepID=UPI0034C65D77